MKISGKFKIQVITNESFKDEIEIDLNKIFNSKQMEFIENEFSECSKNGWSVSEFLANMILDRCKDFANE
jgi:hypothetical protein